MNRKERIEKAIQEQFKPFFILVEDESQQHHVPKGAETHFKITIVSEAFLDQSRIARHRNVNGILQEEFNKGMHALSLYLYTPDEWKEKGGKTSDSPRCRGGFKHG